MSPPPPLVADPGDFVTYTGPLWRIHRPQGSHQPDWAVNYAAPTVTTAFAEVFGARRAVTLSSAQARAQALAGWSPSRPPSLLDLTGKWLLHNGVSASLAGGRRDRCLAWSHAIRRSWPELDGLYVPSTWTADAAVVLFAPARTAFPDAPALARPLSSTALAGTVQ